MFMVLMALIVGLGTGAAVQKFSDRDESLHSAVNTEDFLTEDAVIDWLETCREEIETETHRPITGKELIECVKFGAAHGDI